MSRFKSLMESSKVKRTICGMSLGRKLSREKQEREISERILKRMRIRSLTWNINSTTSTIGQLANDWITLSCTFVSSSLENFRMGRWFSWFDRFVKIFLCFLHHLYFDLFLVLKKVLCIIIQRIDGSCLVLERRYCWC